MDEFVKAVAAVSGRNSAGQTVWGLNEPALVSWNVLPYIWSNGGEITNEDNTKASGYINSEKDDRCRADARGYGEERRAFRLQQR